MEDSVAFEEVLNGAIIIQAAEDYRNVRKGLEKKPEDKKLRKEYEELRKFFLSDSIRDLGFDISGVWLLNELDKEEIL